MKSILLTSGICFVLTLGASAQGLVCKDIATGQTIPCPTFGPQPAKTPAACGLTIAQSPTVRGLRLGMPEADAARLVRQEFRPWPTDPVYLRGLPFLVPPRIGGFEGVELMTLASFDGKLSRIEIKYDIDWKDIGEFVDNFTPKLGVPADAWKIGSTEATMRCRDFDLRLQIISNDLQLVDRNVEEQIAKLKAGYEDDKKKAIKP